MKTILSISLIILSLIHIKAQDTIYKNDGNKIPCKIINEDSAKIDVVIDYNGQIVNTFINRDKIFKIIHANNITKDSLNGSQLRKNLIFSVGIGYGLDFGGLGFNLAKYLTEQIAVFGGVGFNFTPIGFNFGIKYRILNRRQSCVTPYLIGMYGSNGVILYSNFASEAFYGVSLGIGSEFFLNRKNNKSLVVCIFYPIRPNFDRKINHIEESSFEKLKTKPLPIALSLGYIF